MSVSTEQTETMVTVASSRESDSVTSQVPASERLYSGYIGFLAGWIIIVCKQTNKKQIKGPLLAMITNLDVQSFARILFTILFIDT